MAVRPSPKPNMTLPVMNCLTISTTALLLTVAVLSVGRLLYAVASAVLTVA